MSPKGLFVFGAAPRSPPPESFLTRARARIVVFANWHLSVLGPAQWSQLSVPNTSFPVAFREARNEEVSLDLGLIVLPLLWKQALRQHSANM